MKEESYFDTPSRLKQLKEARASNVVVNDHDLEGKYPGSTGTVGCVCMKDGNVAAATSTGCVPCCICIYMYLKHIYQFI